MKVENAKIPLCREISPVYRPVRGGNMKSEIKREEAETWRHIAFDPVRACRAKSPCIRQKRGAAPDVRRAADAGNRDYRADSGADGCENPHGYSARLRRFDARGSGGKIADDDGGFPTFAAPGGFAQPNARVGAGDGAAAGADGLCAGCAARWLRNWPASD